MESYHVLQWSASFDGPWSEIAENRYREGEFDGLSLSQSATWMPSNLEFLHRLDGLRFFSLRARVKNDIAAFTVPSLERLSLVTGSRLRVPDEVQPLLLKLVMTDRPGADIATRWPALESFRLGAFRGTDLRLLSDALKLKHLRIEGPRHSGAVDGIENCQSLENLIIVNYSIRNTAPLRGLKSLTELRMLAARPAAPHEVIDISDLGTSLATLWIANAANIRKIRLLADMPTLREVRLVDCDLTLADRQVLDNLSKVRVRIVSAR
jgi:hypothetical protein